MVELNQMMLTGLASQTPPMPAAAGLAVTQAQSSQQRRLKVSALPAPTRPTQTSTYRLTYTAAPNQNERVASIDTDRRPKVPLSNARLVFRRQVQLTVANSIGSADATNAFDGETINVDEQKVKAASLAARGARKALSDLMQRNQLTTADRVRAKHLRRVIKDYESILHYIRE